MKGTERKEALIHVAREVRQGAQAIREWAVKSHLESTDTLWLETEARELRRNADELDRITGQITRTR